MATTPVNPSGTVVWLEPSGPQATTVPSDLSARLCQPPAAMATTPVNPPGTVAVIKAKPFQICPQVTTVPSDLSARLCSSPAAMATTPVNPPGTVLWP